MALIKISNNRIRFEHPHVLKPDKKYTLGVSHLKFSFERKYLIAILFEWYIPVPDIGGSFTVKSNIHGEYTINSLKN
jgi:hypothetical protein